MSWQSSYAAVLNHPKPILLGLGLCLALAISAWPGLVFDASSDTLVVEGDTEFQTYVEISRRFPGDAYLLVTVTPKEVPLYSPAGLTLLAQIQGAATQGPAVTGSLSLLDVPIIGSIDTASDRTLREHPELLSEARGFFASNHLFAGQLVSIDQSSAAIRLDLMPLPDRSDPKYNATEAARESALQHIRTLPERFVAEATVHIGGVPLIASDMVRFVQADVRTFGAAAAIVTCIMLFGFFRRPRWVLLCVVNAFAVVALMVGLLAALAVPVSVVSANFISLLAIITVALTIHLVVRYRELLRTQSHLSHQAMVHEVMRNKFAPCAYTTLTTVVAFSSLLTSGLPPVEDFGWMMAVGVTLALVVTFLLFPAILLLLPRGTPATTLHAPLALARRLAEIAQTRSGTVVACGVVLAVAAAWGITQLSLDSRFSQYFKPDSDIRTGLEFIDQQLGGLLPLDVIIQQQPFEAEAELAGEDDFFASDDPGYVASAWFTGSKVALTAKMAHYLRSRDDTGSVTALSDLTDLARIDQQRPPLSDIELAMLVSMLGDQQRAQLIFPYANPQSGELRITSRMRESAGTANYPEVVAEIANFSTRELGLPSGAVTTTGMYILFGQSVRQLYSSQRDTLIYVLFATFIMFLVLLRSITFAVTGVIVNALAAACVLGVMGAAAIPLDMMTITIAAICIGIGVDDAIHYLHRYRQERNRGLSAADAIDACALSIGRAIYFTSLTVIGGFSVLVFSNFMPTLYFGLLTAFAMLIALFANLLLLPATLMCLEKFASPAAPSQ